MVDHGWLGTSRMRCAAVSEWAWQWLALPLLMRPVWLLPTGLALVCRRARG